MLTYELNKAPGLPLYEALYRAIRQDILSGRLQPGCKLPSKRTLAENLKVSKITVEGAYDQLLSEGYISSREKVGYFVESGWQTAQNSENILCKPTNPPTKTDKNSPQSDRFPLLDLTANGPAKFPFTVWNRLQRQVMQEFSHQLLQSAPNRGFPAVRRAIADHLRQFRGMTVDPENILIGAGTDFLYNLLIQLLGRDKIYAVEEPGYGKIRKIYAAGGVTCIGAVMDSQGVLPEALTDAQVLHISPSHHFPTGIITGGTRRQALLQWARAAADRWIIEDDYDTEFRFHAHPLAAMQTMDPQRVIYMNSFSKTLAPSIRISYAVLPTELMERFRRELGFYSCTVPGFTQYTLAHFLSEGHFEKHINRMRKFYKTRRNRVVSAITGCKQARKMHILEQNAGLHFLLRVDTGLSDDALTAAFRDAGIRVHSLGSYYHDGSPPAYTHTLIINYSGLSDGDVQALDTALNRLPAL